MDILTSILVGAVAGAGAALWCRGGNFTLTTSLAVGILGGLLGLASNFWLTAGGQSQVASSPYWASGIGAGVILTLWNSSSPPPKTTSDVALWEWVELQVA